jgi:8-hydroxy-5-deazaflavin:NADPH oxidoreductase
MRIGIVGAGDRGSALAELWGRAGHQIAVGDAEDPAAATALAERLNVSTRAMTVEETARFGEVVVLTTPFGRRELLPPPSAVAGNVVIDAMNALTDEGGPLDLGKASSVLVAEWFPDAVVVKAFNAMEAQALLTESRTSVPRERRFAVFIAGDNARANARISTLIEEAGFVPIATGTLARGGRFQEPGSKIFGRQLINAEARNVVRMMG